MTILLVFNRNPYDGTDVTMTELAQWIQEADKVVSF